MKTTIVIAASLSLVIALLGIGLADDTPVSFSGGHDIGPNDFGRPCNLIAAALGVKAEVFREAFSGVTPARGPRTVALAAAVELAVGSALSTAGGRALALEAENPA